MGRQCLQLAVRQLLRRVPGPAQEAHAPPRRPRRRDHLRQQGLPQGTPAVVPEAGAGAGMGLCAGGGADHAFLCDRPALHHRQRQAPRPARQGRRGAGHSHTALCRARGALAEGRAALRRGLDDHAQRAAFRRCLSAHLRGLRRAGGRWQAAGGQAPRPQLRAAEHLQQRGFRALAGAEPAAAQLFLPQRPPREAGGALVSPAQAARRAVRQHLQPGHPDAQAARQLPPLPRTPRAGR